MSVVREVLKEKYVQLNKTNIDQKNKGRVAQHALKIVNSCLYTNIYSYLETSGAQRSNPYTNVVHFFNTRVNYKFAAA